MLKFANEALICIIIAGTPAAKAANVAMSSIAAADFSITNVGEEYQSQPEPNHFVLSEYHAKKPPAVKFVEPQSIETCTLEGTPCSAKSAIALALSRDDHGPKQLHLNYKRRGEAARSLIIELLGPSFPKYNVAGVSSLKSLVLLSPWTGNIQTWVANAVEGNLLAIAPDGGVYFYRHLPRMVMDFKAHRIGKKTFYSYSRIDKGMVGLTLEGKRIILDQDFKFVRELPWASDFHDFLMLGEDHFIVMEPNVDKTPLGTCMNAPHISEYDHGKLVYRLKTADLYKMGLRFTNHLVLSDQGRKCIEPFHLNSFQVVDDNHLLLNYVQFTAMIKKREKQIEWLIRGPEDQFDLPQEYLQAGAHTGWWDPVRRQLSLYVNNPTSKVMEFKLSLNPKKVEVSKPVFEMPFPTMMMGSAIPGPDGVYSVLLGMSQAQPEFNFYEMKEGRAVFKIKILPPFQVGNRAYRHEI